MPFSDAALLIPIQMGMMATIAQIYGVRMEAALAAGLTAAALAENAGKTLVANLLKMLPGTNFIVSGVSAAVAGSFTSALGKSWRLVCERMLNGELEPEDVNAIKKAFLEEFTDLFQKGLDEIRRIKGQR